MWEMESGANTLGMMRYPRTRHLEGSRLQRGDEDLDQVPFNDIAGRHLIIEEKVDGANAGVSFDRSGNILLQSRGHYLVGGPRERHWDPFKSWANAHLSSLFDILGDRYVMYGEWMSAKHTVYYDMLPHLFIEFDVYDRSTRTFLPTPARRALLKGSPVRSALVIHEGSLADLDDLRSLVVRSYFKSGRWKKNLITAAENAGVDPLIAIRQTDMADEMEGLYIKAEDDSGVVDRVKWVRASFSNAVLDSGSHWLDRPIIRNSVAPGVDVW